MKNNKKWIWIGGGAALAVLVIVCAVWMLGSRGSSDPVYVYDFSLVGMTEFWGDQKESYGPVRTDRIQNIMLTDTLTITDIKVNEGDQVKKGDLLMTFDTTLSDLALERKRLEVEKLKLQLEDDEARLVQIRNMRPMVIPSFDTDEEEDQGESLVGHYQIFPAVDKELEIDGSTRENALLCWIEYGRTFNDKTVLDDVLAVAQEKQQRNAEYEAEKAWKQACADAREAGEPEPEYVKPEIHVKDYYVVFKETENNKSKGSQTAWQGVYVRKEEGGYLCSFFDAAGNKDYSQSEEGVDRPQIDYGSGYTAAQLAQMRKDQERKIRETQFSIKMAESEYKIMQKEMVDGNVYAEFDGVVASILPEDEARLQYKPFMKVSGGGGFYIDVSIGELDKDQLKLDQTVTVMDYQSGLVYEGKVVSIGDYPDYSGNGYGMGNPNVTFYPFSVFVDGTASLVEGSYVNVQYSLGESANGIYLEKPYIRTENGSSYVYVQGENGRLEQRFVVTGKSLWGNYTEIRSGLTAEDKLAFPYGKNVKPGASVIPGDYSTMYE